MAQPRRTDLIRIRVHRLIMTFMCSDTHPTDARTGVRALSFRHKPPVAGVRAVDNPSREPLPLHARRCTVKPRRFLHTFPHWLHVAPASWRPVPPRDTGDTFGYTSFSKLHHSLAVTELAQFHQPPQGSEPANTIGVANAQRETVGDNFLDVVARCLGTVSRPYTHPHLLVS